MEYFINCNTSTLAPYTIPLDESKAGHIYRRLGFSASVATINQAIGQSANVLVDTLINEAINQPPLTAPVWANWNNSNYPADNQTARTLRNQQVTDWRVTYTNALINGNLKDRLSFFWSNHLVTEQEVYNCAAFLYEYTTILQRNAIGNFRTLISEIGLSNAMLYYLDGVFNNGDNPNENYARELYELFSLGDGNGYTEEDIIETARALTGYVERGELGCETVTFRADRFDTGTKTIFGQTGNWNYDDVITILFTERANEIASFICKKLYEFFIHPDSNDAAGNAQMIIAGMANTFISNDFEIAPVLSQLFKSQHFFDENAIGVIIKSPYDMYLNLVKETGFSFNDDTVLNIVDAGGMIGQELFDPFDVAGWQRNRQWINTNFIIGRWLTSEMFLQRFFENSPEEFRDFGIAVTGPNGAITNDPNEVAMAIINKITPKGLLETELQMAIEVFREPFNDTEVYENDSWNMTLEMTDSQVYLLLLYLSRQPEFQLK